MGSVAELFVRSGLVLFALGFLWLMFCHAGGAFDEAGSAEGGVAMWVGGELDVWVAPWAMPPKTSVSKRTSSPRPTTKTASPTPSIASSSPSNRLPSPQYTDRAQPLYRDAEPGLCIGEGGVIEAISS